MFLDLETNSVNCSKINEKIKKNKPTRENINHNLIRTIRILINITQN